MKEPALPARPEGPPPPPVVQRLRLRYAKRGRLRFSSHRDFQRALERALRRCQVPMAYSAGFHPRPKISYAGAAPTGTASEAEYVDLGVTHRLDPDAVREALDAALPPGLDIVDMVEAGCQSLADLLQASLWQFTFSTLGPDQAVAVMRRFSALTEAPVQRVTKAGRRSVDTRAAVLHWTVAAEGVTPRDRPGGSDLDGPCAILHLVVRHTTPSVRPDDILTALRSSAGLAPAESVLVTRLAQGPLDRSQHSVADPLAANRMPSTASDDASLPATRTEA